MKPSECIIEIDGKRITAKITWKGGSKFKIIECSDNNYNGLIVDASDILRCIIN
ncbi:MAG: hypothetical protein KatS3mg003_0576 [Candidatus Nitrosocaldaceae archaeon]|nr:MAG: hypothetical protein KatS3mg003_0576 [Candidatus Nitrosocaldaceae archaeon]